MSITWQLWRKGGVGHALLQGATRGSDGRGMAGKNVEIKARLPYPDGYKE